jgi:hypothetical protein
MYFSGGNPGVAELVMVEASAGGGSSRAKNPARIGELIVKRAQRMWCRDEGTSMDNSLSCRNMEGEEGEFSYHLKG